MGDHPATLTAEFFAGAGARAVRRTIFAVGDEKQSIFSFRRAGARTEVMRRTFGALCKGVEHDFGTCTSASFRSGLNVLGAVDNVFARPAALRRPVGGRVKTVHEPLPTPRREWSRSGPPSSPRTSARSRPGTRRSTN